MNMLDKITEKNMVLEYEFPRSECTQSFTEAERKSITSKPVYNNDLNQIQKEVPKLKSTGGHNKDLAG